MDLFCQFPELLGEPGDVPPPPQGRWLCLLLMLPSAPGGGEDIHTVLSQCLHFPDVLSTYCILIVHTALCI